MRCGCFLLVRSLGFFGADLTQCPFVFIGEDLDEFAAGFDPVVQQIASALAAGPSVVILQQFFQLRLIGLTAMPNATIERGFLLCHDNTFSRLTMEVLQRSANRPSSS